MSIKYLIDTSIHILSLRRDKSIRQRLSTLETFYTSTIVLGELYAGAERSVHKQQSMSEIDELVQSTFVLNIDIATAKIFARLSYAQQAKGQMLPSNDLWIAATALQHGLTLIARDEHFTWIDKLSLEQW